MLDRRTFLLTSLAATAGLLSGCRGSQDTLDILLLQNSLPPQLISDFKKAMTKTRQIGLQPEADLTAIFELLEAWQSKEQKSSVIDTLPFRGNTSRANIATLGDSWLQRAIAENLIQPLNMSKSEAWSRFPEVWQNLVKRDRQGNVSFQGEIYGAPYRWGNTVIAYRKDKLDWTPTDWSDLWREELKGRISLLDNYRETIGLTLKKLGYSYNTASLSQVSNLTTELDRLQQQVKFYSSDKYLQPLVLGDTWLAVAWSTDVLPITQRYSDIGVVVPRSGTSLWADVWVQPQMDKQDASSPETASLLSNWIDFCWELRSAKQILLFTKAISPVLTGLSASELKDLTQNLADNPVLESSLTNFENSEFLLPLASESIAEYRETWKTMRV